jgi:membrane fusion protein, multidrug efflux system
MTVAVIPGGRFGGKVKAIDARVSAESRNVTVRAEFDNPDHKLLPGMFANLTVTMGAPAEVLTLPRTAIVYSLYGDNVFVVEPAKPSEGQKGPGGLVVERRFVRLGPVRGERIAVAEGLKEGERVVIAGQIKLEANSPVTIDETPALPLPAVTPRP